MLNLTVIMGRLTRDAELRYSQGNNTAIARFTLAVDRDYQKEGEERTADFISCVAFGKTAEFIGKYFAQGSMLAITGKIQTGSYVNKDGQKVYTTDVVVDKASFTGEKRGDSRQPASGAPNKANDDGFMNIPDNVYDSGLPF